MTKHLFRVVLTVIVLSVGYPTMVPATQTEGQAIMDDKTLYMAISVQLEKIDAEIAAQNWKVASELLKQALAELGNRYTRSDTIDDSGMGLIAAELQEREGKPDNAAHVRRRILAERLEMLRSKIK